MGWKHDMWAWTACVDTPAECLTLLWLNQRADDESGECFPSAEDIAAHTRLNRKTVFAAIKSLTEKGLIETKKRPGPGRRNLYRLCYERTENGTSQKWNVPEKVLSTSQKRDFQGAKNGTSNVPETVRETTIETTTESIKKLPESSMRTSGNSSAIAAVASAQAQTPPGLDDEAEAEWNDLTARAALEADSMPEDVFSPDAQIPIENIEILNATASDSIFGTDTPPKDQNAAERKSETISKPKRKRVSSSVVKDKPEDISQEVWDDWLTTRRAKRLPLTQTALNSVRREAASAGLTFQAAVTFAVEQGWAAFRAEWYRNATRKGDSTKTNARYLTAQERYEERMRKAGEMSDEEYFAQFDLPEEILNYEKAQEAKRHVAS